MKDLSHPAWIKIKGALFLLTGVASALLLIFQDARWQNIVLLVIAIWSFCRAYYFAFYVIEKYVDPSYRFSGLGTFLVYLWKKNRQR